jgi:uncharacterized protein
VRSYFHPGIATHLLALLLVVIWPAWDYWRLRLLKARPDASSRLRYYRQLTVCLWSAALAACWAQGFSNLATLAGLGIQAGWLEQHRWVFYALVVIVGLVVAGQLVLPLVQVSVRYQNREFLEPKQFESLRFFLPNGRLQRRWWAGLSVTAGFTEELLFRGFLLRYLHTSPLHLPLVWAAVISALVFGAHHLYQGTGGFVSTTVLGLVLTAMLLLTGVLWAGVLYHAAVDLSLLVYWRPKPVTTGPSSESV